MRDLAVVGRVIGDVVIALALDKRLTEKPEVLVVGIEASAALRSGLGHLQAGQAWRSVECILFVGLGAPGWGVA